MNILIVNYNTQNLTNACILSVLKTTPDVNIYVFDNSDIEPFKNSYDNVTVIDNTKGDIINFDKILNSYDNKTEYGSESGFGTLKHTMSIDKCFDIINDNFILLDSDVLVKKDLTELCDEGCIYVADEEINGKSKKMRVSPHVCFINVNACKKYGIRYFDEKRIVGLSKESDDYDTGSSFYFDCKGHKSKKITEKNWIVHYGAGSWVKMTKLKKISEDEWLKKYIDLWSDKKKVNESNVDIFICTHKSFEPKVKSSKYKIIDSRYITVDLPLKDDFFSEFYQYKYVNDNIPLEKYVGFCHYRRYFSFFDDVPDLDYLFSKCDIIIGKPIKYDFSIKEQYERCHNIEDLYLIGGILTDKYPEYSNVWHNFINGNTFIPYNMFIMKSEDFKKYCEFIFTIMGEYLKIVGVDIYKRIENNKEHYLKHIKKLPQNSESWYQYRIGGYIGERLTNIFIIKNFSSAMYYKVITTEDKYKTDK